MRRFIDDGHSLALRALRKCIGTETTGAATTAPPHLVIEEISSRDWASATFVGQHHQIDLRLEGGASAVISAAEAVRARIGTMEVEGGDKFLAEAAVTHCALSASGAGAAARITIEALTLEA